MRNRSFCIIRRSKYEIKKYTHCRERHSACKKILSRLIWTGYAIRQRWKYDSDRRACPAAACWTESLNKEVLPRNNHSELYFEETDIEAFAEKLEQLYPETEYVSKLMTRSWGQKVIRFYDLDGNLIEVGTPAYFNYVTPIEVSRK